MTEKKPSGIKSLLKAQAQKAREKQAESEKKEQEKKNEKSEFEAPVTEDTGIFEGGYQEVIDLEQLEEHIIPPAVKNLLIALFSIFIILFFAYKTIPYITTYFFVKNIGQQIENQQEFTNVFRQLKNASNIIFHKDKLFINTAEIYLKKSDYFEAERILLYAGLKFPEETNIYDALVKLYIESQEYNKAEKLIDKLLGDVDYRYRAKYYLAQINFYKKKYSKAAGYLIKMIKEKSDDPKPVRLLRNIYLEKGDYEKALYYHLSLKAIKEDYTLDDYIKAGEIYTKRKEYFKAEENFLKAYKQTPTIDALNGLIKIYTQTNKLKSVQEILNDFIKKGKLDKKSYMLAARIFVRIGKAKESVELLKDLLDRDPNDGEIYYLLGKTYLLHLANPAGAEAYFENSLEKNFIANDLYFYKAIANLKLKRFKEAINDFESCPEHCADEAILNYNKALAYLFEEKYKKAVIYFNKALDSNMKIPELYNNLGAAYEGAGNIKGALKFYTLAIDSSYDFTDITLVARKNLNRVLSGKGKFDVNSSALLKILLSTKKTNVA